MGKSLLLFWQSSIGKKIVVAVTGVLLVGFLLAHMAGNLLIFVDRDAINGYAEFLHHMLHGAGIWVARIGLLVSFVLHIVATVSLTRQNKAARKENYEKAATVQASRSSRMMIVSGLVILAFVIFHILHFTTKTIDPSFAKMEDSAGRADVYAMVINGLEIPWISLFYIVAISLLCSHLSHGIASIFQTLGLRSRKTEKSTKMLSWAITILLWIGFLIVPLTILLDFINVSDGEKEAKSAQIEQTVQCTVHCTVHCTMGDCTVYSLKSKGVGWTASPSELSRLPMADGLAVHPTFPKKRRLEAPTTVII